MGLLTHRSLLAKEHSCLAGSYVTLLPTHLLFELDYLLSRIPDFLLFITESLRFFILPLGSTLGFKTDFINDGWLADDLLLLSHSDLKFVDLLAIFIKRCEACQDVFFRIVRHFGFWWRLYGPLADLLTDHFEVFSCSFTLSGVHARKCCRHFGLLVMDFWLPVLQAFFPW